MLIAVPISGAHIMSDKTLNEGRIVFEEVLLNPDRTVKVVGPLGPDREVFVDGIHGIINGAGIIKLGWFTTGFENSPNERRELVCRMVMNHSTLAQVVVLLTQQLANSLPQESIEPFSKLLVKAMQNRESGLVKQGKIAQVSGEERLKSSSTKKKSRKN